MKEGMRDHYEERIAYARKSDDFEGWMDEILKGFLRDLTSGRIPARDVPVIAGMLNDASCEAAMAVAS